MAQVIRQVPTKAVTSKPTEPFIPLPGFNI